MKFNHNSRDRVEEIPNKIDLLFHEALHKFSNSLRKLVHQEQVRPERGCLNSENRIWQLEKKLEE